MSILQRPILPKPSPSSIKTRKQAAADGDKLYYTGKPCRKGHDSMRYTSTGMCFECCRAYNHQFRADALRLQNAKAAGAFLHMLHPDDHAAARAYCQALDIARGRTPWAPLAASSTPARRTMAEVEADRLRIIGAAAAQGQPPAGRTVDDLDLTR